MRIWYFDLRPITISAAQASTCGELLNIQCPPIGDATTWPFGPVKVGPFTLGIINAAVATAQMVGLAWNVFYPTGDTAITPALNAVGSPWKRDFAQQNISGVSTPSFVINYGPFSGPSTGGSGAQEIWADCKYSYLGWHDDTIHVDPNIDNTGIYLCGGAMATLNLTQVPSGTLNFQGTVTITEMF